MMKKLQITLTVMLILASALLWAAKPQPVAMRRESAIQPAKIEIALSLDEALNRSLAYGDGRRVNWEAVGF